MSKLRPNGVVAILTDFGTVDHFVGVVKGKILQELKAGQMPLFIDITHEIPPQNIVAGALKLKFSYKYFPKGTIFLAIVDPGVGSQRRAIVVETEDYFFVGPDNGLFSLVLMETKPRVVYEILTEIVLKPPYSATFHGRDLFAPAVALLLCGVPLSEWAKIIDSNELVSLDIYEPEPISGGYRLQIIDIDRFGNLITNLSQELLGERKAKVVINGQEIRIVRTYSDAERGEVVALFSSEGLLEIAVREGSAKEFFGQKLPEIFVFINS